MVMPKAIQGYKSVRPNVIIYLAFARIDILDDNNNETYLS